MCERVSSTELVIILWNFQQTDRCFVSRTLHESLHLKTVYAQVCIIKCPSLQNIHHFRLLLFPSCTNSYSCFYLFSFVQKLPFPLYHYVIVSNTNTSSTSSSGCFMLYRVLALVIILLRNFYASILSQLRYAKQLIFILCFSLSSIRIYSLGEREKGRYLCISALFSCSFLFSLDN